MVLEFKFLYIVGLSGILQENTFIPSQGLGNFTRPERKKYYLRKPGKQIK
jgi:hypothetical protein